MSPKKEEVCEEEEKKCYESDGIGGEGWWSEEEKFFGERGPNKRIGETGIAAPVLIVLEKLLCLWVSEEYLESGCSCP